MKYIKIKIGLCIVLALFSSEISAQSSQRIDIKAIVADSQGNPIAGAVIRGKDKLSVTSNESGNFSIEIDKDTPLHITALGYQTQSLLVDSLVKIITLPSSSETVNLAFRQIDKKDIPGGVSYLNLPELMTKNDMNSSGIRLDALLPGANGNIWGSYNLVLVDGLPRDFGNLSPSEIEQITLLKGVSAVALYGSMASKGVLLITTKRGSSMSNDFRVRANTGIYVPKSYPKYLGSAEYMTLYNEARRNDGLSDLYSEEDIYNYGSGTNPYRYPDVDYYSSDYLKKYSRRTDVATEFRGGNDRAQFYANMGFYQSNSLLNVGEGKNESISRFHVRGNVDIKINDFITGRINTSMAFYDTDFAKGNYWSNASTLRPNWYTPLIPISYLDQSDAATWQIVKDSPFVIDGKYLLGGKQQQLTNPFAALYTQGSEKYTSRQYQFDATLNFDLSSLVTGLSFSSQFGVDYYSRYYLNENINDYAVYEAIWNNNAGYDQITSLKKFNQDKVKRERNLDRNYQYRKTFFTGMFKYQNTFNHDHNVSATLLALAYQQTIAETYHKPSNANLGLQASYNFQHKYYADFTGNLVHSAKLAPGKRQAISPTFSLGWRISQEKFMSDIGFIDNLKITASAGTLNTDMDISDYYMYSGVYVRPAAWTGYDYRWSENYMTQITDIRRGENLNLGFIKRKEFNLGLESSLFNNQIQITASYFRTKMDGLIILNNNKYPSYFVWNTSNFLPYENFNGNEFKGFDFGISTNKKVDKVDLGLGFIGTYSTGKATKRSENYANHYQTRVGQPLDGYWGLVSDGFFMSESEINDSKTPNYTFGKIRPGDMKYIDQNGDGKIDKEDEVFLGRSNAPFRYGINITAKWNNFTFFALFQGQTGGHGMKTNDYYRVRGDRKYSEVVRDRTIINKNESGEWVVTQLGRYPRLTTSGDTNFQNSDYWMYKTDYLSLAQVQLSYDIPQRLLENIFIKDLGVYVNGADLLTIAKERKVMDLRPGESPASRFFNIGFKATF